MIWTLLGIFAGGMALNLTPCVYPLIPITVSYFGGQAGQAPKGSKQARRPWPVLHGRPGAHEFGARRHCRPNRWLMGAMLQNPVVLIVVAAVLVFFATSLFGLWELRLPSGLIQSAAKTYPGYFGSLFMGLTLGVVAAP